MFGCWLNHKEILQNLKKVLKLKCIEKLTHVEFLFDSESRIEMDTFQCSRGLE